MSKLRKLIEGVRNNPKDVRFADACKIAEHLGFSAKARRGTSHAAFSRPGEQTLLNFQDRDGKIPPYQARQLTVMIDRYDDGGE